MGDGDHMAKATTLDVRERAAVLALVSVTQGKWHETASMLSEVGSAIRFLRGDWTGLESFDREKSYKNPWGTPQQRMQLAALYSRVLHEHGTCIRAKAGMDWDTVTIVPSSGARTGPHPLENVVSMAPAVGPLYRPLLARGAEAITHNQASDGGYQVTTPVAGRRIVLVDDTFTTGGRVQSAASALQRAGATVVAAVVAGRIINPTYGTSEALWAKQRAKAFRFDQCCLCADV